MIHAESLQLGKKALVKMMDVCPAFVSNSFQVHSNKLLYNCALGISKVYAGRCCNMTLKVVLKIALKGAQKGVLKGALKGTLKDALA